MNPLTAGRKTLSKSSFVDQGSPHATAGAAKLRGSRKRRDDNEPQRIELKTCGCSRGRDGLVVVDILFKDYNTKKKPPKHPLHKKNTFEKNQRIKGVCFLVHRFVFSLRISRFGTWNKNSQTWRRVLTNIMSAPYLLPPLSVWHVTRGTCFFYKLRNGPWKPNGPTLNC